MTTLPPTLAAERSLRELARLSRGDVLRLMRRGVTEPWLRNAFANAHPTDMTILGRFDLTGADGSTPHPAVCARILRRPSRAGQIKRDAVLALYLGADESWAVDVWRSPPWRQYAGDPEGEPGVFNGDEPGAARG